MYTERKNIVKTILLYKGNVRRVENKKLKNMKLQLFWSGQEELCALNFSISHMFHLP